MRLARPLRASLITALLLAPAAWLAQAAQPAQNGLPQGEWAQRAATCIACHTGNGAASPTGYVPRIAGKPEGYLYQQLLNFRDGRRHQSAMARQLANLDDSYLHGLAAYFASLQLPYPAPTVVPTAAAAQRGRALLLQGDAARGIPACTSCHGDALTGRSTQVPGLLGLPPDYLSAQLGAWRTGVRKGPEPDCMATIARALPAEDIAAITRWLAAQTAPASGMPASTLSPAPATPPLPCGAMEPR